MERLFTGGLKPLALVGKMAELIADLDNPVMGQRAPDFGNRIHSGLNEVGVGDCALRLWVGSLMTTVYNRRATAGHCHQKSDF